MLLSEHWTVIVTVT